MKICDRIGAALLAARIEYHWRVISHCRKRGEGWISRGEPLSSGRLLRLNDRMNSHGVLARECERKYGDRFLL